ncbi:MAG: hypothetical protein M0004_16165 [Actinomycetota bacterium]|nr:hypothetical protein [Actinomycetota bacterium]
MKLAHPRTLPGRLATGVYILHAGFEKWNAPHERAEGVHAMAAGAYPPLSAVPPARFLKLLAGAEIATGAALVMPLVDSRLAGLALTAFSAGLLGLYWRSPGMRRAGSIWPTPAGMAVSKDVWMLGIGLGLLAEGAR